MLIFMGMINNIKSTLLLYPTYFSPIVQYVALVQADTVFFEVEDNYQKQTYRTRCYIFSPNGKQLLNIPVRNANSKQKTRDVIIDYSFNWQKQHLKSIQAAYRSSPYFEYYEDSIQVIFESKPTFLLDFNLKCQDVIFELLQLDLSYNKTTNYEKQVVDIKDVRVLVDAKSQIEYNLDAYTQVFSEKHDFIANLSILDLLFMEGTNALNYLENQTIDFL